MKPVETVAARPGVGLVPQLAGLVVLVALVAGGAVGAVAIDRTDGALREEVLSSNLAAANLAAQLSFRYVEAARASMLELAGRATVVEAIMEGAPERAEPELASLLEANSRIDNVGIYSPAGIGLVAGLAGSQTVGSSVADREWFQEVMTTRRPYLSVPVISRGTGRPIVPYGVPVTDRDGTVRAVVGAGISIAALSDAITGLQTGPEARTSLIDARQGGIILAHVDRGRVLTPVSGQNEAAMRAVAGERGVMETASSSGEWTLASFSPVPDLPWAVLILQPSAEALAPVNALTRQLLLLVGLVTLATAAAGAALALRISAPLARLRDAANAMAAGDLSTRVGFHRRDELGEVGRAFDRMAAALAQRTSQLEDANDRLARAAERERDLARQAERHSAQISALLASLTDAVTVTDAAGNVLLRNEAALRITGYTREQMVANRASGQPNVVRPDGSPYPFTEVPLSRALRGERFSEKEVLFRRRDGSLASIAASGGAVLDEAGNVAQAIVVFRDVTERKRAEAERERLLAEVERRAADLETANRELEAFSYSVSHDLRAPLRAIDGFSRILVEEHAPRLSPEAGRYLQIVRNSAQKMGHLIDDLLTFSRLGRQAMNKQRVLPAELARQVLADLQTEQQGRRVEVSIREMPPCLGDPTLLRQVLANLLANALKFTRRREVATIEVGGREEGEEHVYFVKDNGVGFNPRYAGKLFGVFQRLHRAEEYEGTGVGLAIVQRVIHRHGGRVWAESTPNQGATFYFALPGGTEE